MRFPIWEVLALTIGSSLYPKMFSLNLYGLPSQVRATSNFFLFFCQKSCWGGAGMKEILVLLWMLIYVHNYPQSWGMPGEKTSADAHMCVIWITRKEIRTSVLRVRTGIFPLASLECYRTKSPIHSYPHYWKSEAGSCLHHVTYLQMKTICWLLQAVLSVRQLHDQASILAFGSPPPFLCY